MTRQQHQDRQNGRKDRSATIFNVLCVASTLLALAIGAGLTFDYVQQIVPGAWLLGAQAVNLVLILLCARRLATRATRRGAGERAQSVASRDPLTGFLHRNSLTEEGAAMFARAHRR